MFRTGDDTKKKGIEHTLGIFIKLARGFRVAEIEAKKVQKRAEELDSIVYGKSGRQGFSGKNGTHAGDVERVEGLPDFVELLGQMALGVGAHIKEDAGIIGILLKEGEPETEIVFCGHVVWLVVGGEKGKQIFKTLPHTGEIQSVFIGKVVV